VKDKRKKIISVIALTIVITTVVFYIHIKKEEFTSAFKNNLSKALSDATGADITIGRISSNIFTTAIISDLNCRRGNYEVNFGIARLEYPLFDIMTGRRGPIEELETVITLGEGDFRFKNNLIIDEIKGVARLIADEIILEKFNCDLFDLLSCRAKGKIVSEEGRLRVDLVSSLKPLFDKDKTLFEEIRISLKGTNDNLTIYGQIKDANDIELLLSGYLLSSEEGRYNIGSEIFFKDKEGRDTRESVIIETEVDKVKSTSETVIILKQGNISFLCDYSKWPMLKAVMKNNHIKIYGVDFSNIIDISLNAVFKDYTFSYATIDANTESTIINYYPFEEVESSIWIDKDVARLIYLKLGDTISASGALSIKPPRSAVLKIAIKNFMLDHPYLVAMQNQEPGITGSLSGDLLFEGPIEKLNTKINLEAENGRFGTLKYENMIINVNGKGHLLEVSDSRIVRKDSFFPMNGPIDMHNFGTDKFLENVIISSDEKAIIWEGWDVLKVEEDGALSIRKALGKGVNVGFKTYTSVDETTYDPVGPQSEMGLEYNLLDEEGVLKNGTIEFKAKEREEFFGIKKKYQF